MSYGKRRSDAYLDEQGPKKKRQRRSYKEVGRDLLTFFEEKARSDQRLQNAFESIFEKYGQDFSGVGDEIDLQSGRIIVDNGHVKNLNLVPDDKDYSRHASRGAKSNPKRLANAAKRRSAPARLNDCDSDSSDTIMRSPGPPLRRSPLNKISISPSSTGRRKAKSQASETQMPRNLQNAKASHSAWAANLRSDDDLEDEPTSVATGKSVREGASPEPEPEPRVTRRNMTNVRVYVPRRDMLNIEQRKRNLEDAIWSPTDKVSEGSLSDNDSLFGGSPQEFHSPTEARSSVKPVSEDGDLFVTPEPEPQIDDAQLPVLDDTRDMTVPGDVTSPTYNTRRSVASYSQLAKSGRNFQIPDSEQTDSLSTIHSSLDHGKQKTESRPEEVHKSTSRASASQLPFPKAKLAELGTSLELGNTVTQHNARRTPRNLSRKRHNKTSQMAEETGVTEIKISSSAKSKTTAAVEIESKLRSDVQSVPNPKVRVPRKRKKGMLFVVGKHRKALYRTPQKSSPGSGYKVGPSSRKQLASDTHVATPSRKSNSRGNRGEEVLSSPDYLKPEFYKSNGRPKQRLLSSSLNLSTARRLLSS